MDKFLYESDALGNSIQQQAVELYQRLNSFSIDDLDIPYYCKEYYKGSHSRRLFFSIETSAHILYRAIKLSGKAANELVIMDYGAGVGSLFLLAKMIGSTVIYNDHLEDWKNSAMAIAEKINIKIDHYIVGDIAETLEQISDIDIDCDLILSRNVIEHIYKLDAFFTLVHLKQPAAIIFSSTTANFMNPASVIKHMVWHRKWEKEFVLIREAMIRKERPDLKEATITKLAVKTRGLAMAELENEVRHFQGSDYPDPSIFRTNTCDPANGVWFEHMLSIREYRALIDQGVYTTLFEPGFWDTHYSSKQKNMVGKSLNTLMKLGWKTAMSLAPFIYVIAIPKKANQ